MDIPLFPLHTVLCPGIVVPLHIFEDALSRPDPPLPRQRHAVRRRADPRRPRGRRPAASWRWPASGRSRRSGEAGRYPDGRYDLLAAGTGRFAIESVDTAAEPYLVAEVTPLEDEVGDEPRAERLAASAIRRFVRYLELMRARDGETADVLDIRVELDASGPDDEAEPDADRTTGGTRGTGAATLEPEDETDGADETADRSRPVIPDDPTVLSYLLSGIVEVELPRRQALLEAETTVDRLESLVRLLDRELMLLSGRLRIFSPTRGSWVAPAAAERGPGRCGGPARRALRLLAEALFLPGVGVVVVAVALPEAELVVVEELQATDPLAALPEVALRDDQAQRIAVLRLERLAVERVGQDDVVVIEDRQRAGWRCSPARRATRRAWPTAGRRPSRGWSGWRRPPKSVSSFDQRVTQWMSVWTVLRGRALNWSQVSVNGESTSPQTLKSHVARSTRGTEP